MSKGGVGGGQQTPFGGQSQSFYHQRPPSFRSPGPIRPPYFRDPPVWGPPPFRPPMRSPGKGGQSPWSPATNPIFMPGSSYRQPWIPSGYGQMQYSPQRFSGYGALPDMSYPSPIRPPYFENPRLPPVWGPPSIPEESRIGTLGGVGYGRFPLGTAGPEFFYDDAGNPIMEPSTPPQQQQQAEVQAEGQADQTVQTGQAEQIAQTGQTAIPQNQTFQIPGYAGDPGPKSQSLWSRWTPAQRSNWGAGVSSGRGYFNQVRPNYENQFGNYSLGNYGQAIDLAANGGIVGIPRGRMR